MATSSSIIWVGTETGLYGSKNMGRSWYVVDTPYIPIIVTSVYHHDNDLIIGTENGELFQQTDERWTQLSQDLFTEPINAIQKDGSHLLVIVDDRLVYSSDAGKNWIPLIEDKSVTTFTCPEGLQGGQLIWVGYENGTIEHHLIP